MIKLIASDFDGTLFRSGVISERDRAAVTAWRASGNLFGIVTGRGKELPGYVTGELQFALDFVVCSNGAMIFNGTPELIETHTAPGNDRTLLEELAREHGANHWGYNQDEGMQGDFYQLSVLLPDDAVSVKFAEAVNEKFPELTAFQNGRNTDIIRRGISKATGIERVVELLGHGDVTVAAVGDNFNDMPMIEAFNGYAIAGSPITAHAGNTCADIADLCEIMGKI